MLYFGDFFAFHNQNYCVFLSLVKRLKQTLLCFSKATADNVLEEITEKFPSKKTLYLRLKSLNLAYLCRNRLISHQLLNLLVDVIRTFNRRVIQPFFRRTHWFNRTNITIISIITSSFMNLLMRFWRAFCTRNRISVR